MARAGILRDSCGRPQLRNQVCRSVNAGLLLRRGWTRISGRGKHEAPFAEAAAIDIANAYTSAVYLDKSEDETYFGLSEAEFTKILYSNSLVWAPDGDEAFDDGSYVLQFDVGDRVRLIAFKRPEPLVDPASVREVWLSSDTFYSALCEWRDAFMAEWESLPKHD